MSYTPTIVPSDRWSPPQKPLKSPNFDYITVDKKDKLLAITVYIAMTKIEQNVCKWVENWIKPIHAVNRL